jgi:hypothetical protein
MLSQGVVRPPGGTRGDAMQQAGNLVNVLGQRSGHNLYLMDGVTITDEHFNNMVIAASIDAIEEFTLKLRIVNHQLQCPRASGCGEDRSGFKQPVGHGVGKVGPLDVLHGGLDGNRVQQIALDN